MDRNKASGPTTATSTAALLLLCILFALRPADAFPGPLKLGFYDDTCPQAEEIVRDVVTGHVFLDPTIPAALVRLLFHDCFVRGCDASILLDATPSGETVEKGSPANGSTLRGLEVIDDAKFRLEMECPGTVSCADVLAFATRDAAVLAGLPSYPVHAGRRDGRVSLASDVITNLPFPTHSVEQLKEIFGRKGFEPSELVILSGAHSIGGAHCSSFAYRLYNFSSELPQDPSINPLHAKYLKLRCPSPGTLLADLAEPIVVTFNTFSSLRLDGSYYTGLLNGKGLLTSDQTLTTDKKTKAIVERMAQRPDKWAKMFGEAMMKLGALDVLVGDQGEVRRSCRFVN